MQVAVGACECIKSAVQLFQKRCKPLVTLMARLVFKYIRQRFFDSRVCFEALCFGVTLDLVLVQSERNSLAHSCHAEFALRVQHHASLLDTLAELLIDSGYLIFDFRRGCGFLFHVGETACPFGQHLRLFLFLDWEEGATGRKACFATLKVEHHLACHFLRVFRKIFVVHHAVLLDDGNFLTFDLSGLSGIVVGDTHACHICNVYGVWRRLAVDALAHDYDVRCGPRASECLVVHTESTHHISIALAGYPTAQLL